MAIGAIRLTLPATGGVVAEGQKGSVSNGGRHFGSGEAAGKGGREGGMQLKNPLEIDAQCHDE